MVAVNELTLVEMPILDFLEKKLGYERLASDAAMALRLGDNQVILRSHLVQALIRINQIPQASAEAITSELLSKSRNEEWLSLLRGNYSRTVPGRDGHQTIRIIDFADPSLNTFVVTNQLAVKGVSYRIADVVVYVNGIPLVVIEAKSSIGKKDTWDAIDDIGVYEREVPRLFATNLFNIATNGLTLRYAATAAEKSAWVEWKDPYPVDASVFKGNALHLGLTSLLDKKRLLDLLAHFVVFEKDPTTGTSTKKMCRYQQYRAVHKLVDRVAFGKHKRGLIWHTQGSGKSLTMAFATLKLKFHLGVKSERLSNPNILVLTDRKDLHTQISQTFQACGLPNPEPATSIKNLRQLIHSGSKGRVVLSTIHKFMDSEEPVAKSDDWILLVDEAHRTQEKDLGAYLRLTFPDAYAFGFTGTPVKKNDLDTAKNFGAPGEAYLDRYSIDDAVADGATVPIRYLSRMALWNLDDAKLNVVFDQTFGHEPKSVQDLLKARGITRGDLSRFEPRIALVAFDIWTHFKQNVQPDGFKAQIVCADRKACTIYKRSLDAVIAASFVKQGMPQDEAEKRAAAMSVCIYSSNGKEDLKPGNEDLANYYLDEVAEKKAIEKFKTPNDPLSFIIVCDKLLTGFDAPIEQAMYLDSPLVDHGLLQAIARVNRRYGARKDHGLIVDYCGITRDLGKALSSYKKEDVAGAAGDFDELRKALVAAHKECFAFLKGLKRTDDVAADVHAAVALIPGEDVWYDFRDAASAFLKAHAAVGSDPIRLKYSDDAKFTAAVLAYGRMKFEQVIDIDFKGYSEKIREMLVDHLRVTGLKTLVQMRSLSDPAFWMDFDDDRREGDIQTAAERKLTELKHELTEKAAKNPAQYATLAARVRELIRQMEQRQITAAQALKEQEKLVEEAIEAKIAYRQSGLDEHEFAIFSALKNTDAGDGKPPATPPATQFSSKAIDHLAGIFARWDHPRVVGKKHPFKLGTTADARAVIELLERIAQFPTPKIALQQSVEYTIPPVGGSMAADSAPEHSKTAVRGKRQPAAASGMKTVTTDPWADLSTRIIKPVQRLVAAVKEDPDVLAMSRSQLIRVVEPFFYKVLALTDPKEFEKLAGKKQGLTAIIRKLQLLKRIPYEVELSDAEFRKLEGWELRTSYENAVRDVLPARLAEAHEAKETDADVWYAAFVLLLGVVQRNEKELRAAMADVKEPKPQRPETEDSAFSEADMPLRDLAREVAGLYKTKASAPAGWQDKGTVKDDLWRKSKRLLLDFDKVNNVKRTKEERDAILARIQSYAAIHYAR
jgi:type I restriction enzyme R subunit